MAALRSTQFYEGVPPIVGGVSTWTSVYTVPAGHRIILKGWQAYNGAAVNKTFGIRVHPSQIIANFSIGAGVTNMTIGWIVLNPTEVLDVFQQSGGATAYILSGYLLFI
jgi:hypothetical protein